MIFRGLSAGVLGITVFMQSAAIAAPARLEVLGVYKVRDVQHTTMFRGKQLVPYFNACVERTDKDTGKVTPPDEACGKFVQAMRRGDELILVELPETEE